MPRIPTSAANATEGGPREFEMTIVRVEKDASDRPNAPTWAREQLAVHCSYFKDGAEKEVKTWLEDTDRVGTPTLGWVEILEKQHPDWTAFSGEFSAIDNMDEEYAKVWDHYLAGTQWIAVWKPRYKATDPKKEVPGYIQPIKYLGGYEKVVEVGRPAAAKAPQAADAVPVAPRSPSGDEETTKAWLLETLTLDAHANRDLLLMGQKAGHKAPIIARLLKSLVQEGAVEEIQDDGGVKTYMVV